MIVRASPVHSPVQVTVQIQVLSLPELSQNFNLLQAKLYSFVYWDESFWGSAVVKVEFHVLFAVFKQKLILYQN